MMMTIQRPERRSKRMCGSLVKLLFVGGVITELKNVSMLALSAPSATPVALLKVRMRPFTATVELGRPHRAHRVRRERAGVRQRGAQEIDAERLRRVRHRRALGGRSGLGE